MGAGNETEFNWTGLKADDPVSQTRLALGDIDPNDPLFDDGTILAALSLANNSPTIAAAALADAQAALAIRDVDRKIGNTTLKGKSAKEWRELADRLRALGPGALSGAASTGVGGILAGGIRRSEFKRERSQTEFQPFSNEIGMDDHPGGPRETGRKFDTRGPYDDDCF